MQQQMVLIIFIVLYMYVQDQKQKFITHVPIAKDYHVVVVR